MGNFDLSEATTGRVAGQTVDMLRIANQDVWIANPETPTDYTIFGGAAIPDLGSHDDAGSGAWLANQFRFLDGPDLEVMEVGLYVPSDSLLIGRVGYISAQAKVDSYIRGEHYPSVMKTNDLAQIMSSGLVVGWNWFSLAHPMLWNTDNAYMLAGYSLDTGYLYNSLYDIAEIPSADGGNMALSIHNGSSTGVVGRSWYANGDVFDGTDAHSYGIDVRVRKAI